MELKQYVSTLWKWSWLIVLSTLVATVSCYYATSRMPRIYSTSTTMMVGRFIQADDPSGQDFYISQQLAQTYVQLVTRQPVLQGAIDTLGLDMPWGALAGRVSTGMVPGTQLIWISVQDTDPQRAKALADEIARQLILQSPTPVEQEQSQYREFVSRRLETLQVQIEEGEKQIEELEGRLALENSARGIQDIQSQIETLQGKVTTWQSNYAGMLDFYKGSRTNYLSVVEPAMVPTVPVSPNVKYYLLLAAAIGFTLAAGGAFLIEFLDNTIKTEQDVERILTLPTLGTITRIGRVRDPADHLVTMQDPYAPVTEVYRVLRTNIQFSLFNNPSPRLLVTSASPAEGKTTISCNLAIIIAYTGKRVILVDADLRRPSVHRFFGAANQVGLTSLLLEDSLPTEGALVETSVEGLRIMPSGPLPPNPAELLGSEPMKKRLDEMKELADVIVFDTPPVLAVTDAVTLGALCSGVVLVVDAGRTRSELVRRAKGVLDQVDLKILGVVLNKLTARQAGGYYYYNHYSHAGKGRRGKRKNPKTASTPKQGLLGRMLQPESRQIPGNGRSPGQETIEDQVVEDQEEV